MHPEDARIFSQHALPALCSAVADLCWLQSRGYAVRAALALVGDRGSLTARQREAVRRCACSDAQRAERAGRAASAKDLDGGGPVWIDAFNVLTTVEAAIGGGILLACCDGALRDMASMHGSYRPVEETRPAIEALAGVLTDRGVKQCRWLLDAPVSNSGRLAEMLRGFAAERGLPWDVELISDPDPLLESPPASVLVASADSRIMDAAPLHWQLAREAVERIRPAPSIIDLTEGAYSSI